MAASHNDARYHTLESSDAASLPLQGHPTPLSDGDNDSEDAGLLSEDYLSPSDDNLSFRRASAAKRRNRTQFWPSCQICPSRKICIVSFASIFALLFALLAFGGLWVYNDAPKDGLSPPWYPTPNGGTVQSWKDSYEKARALVVKMTLVEKVNITTGTGWSMNLCVGNTAPANFVGFPSLCLQDGPLGIRFADNSTAFPAGITVGATWNRTLMRQRGAAHGREARLKGVNVLLGPAMGPIGRNPAGGRNWEGFGSDPVLQAIAASETIKGIQSEGIIATAKHYVGNEQEHFRKPYEWGLPHAVSANIDDRAMHEVYAWPFAESIRAGVASVMCSYQLVNNSYACGNSKLMNGILKDEMGFQGFVQSDWLATQSGVGASLAGLDVTMPGDGLGWMDGKSLWGSQLTLAVLNGSLPMERLNDMATRVVAAWYQLGQDKFDGQGPNFSSWTNERVGKIHEAAQDSDELAVVNEFVNVRSDHSTATARQVAAEGIVLLKNEGGVLPLNRSGHSITTRKLRVSIIGDDAGLGNGLNTCVDRSCNEGTLAVGWGSGASEFPYLIDPFSALKSAFGEDSIVTSYLHNDISSNLKSAIFDADLCLVFANADSGEGYLSWNGIRGDRNDLNLQKDGDKLIQTVAGQCGNGNGDTFVVIHSVGPVIVESWSDLPGVKAILLANLPGQESGNALVDVLFGAYDASGRLPYTVGKTLEDYGPDAQVIYLPKSPVPQDDFNEGLYVDYRHFDKFNIEPRYPFGFGLSYTTFELSNLVVTETKPRSPLPSPREPGLQAPKYDKTIPDATSALFPKGFRKLSKYVYPYISSVDEVKSGKYPYPAGFDTRQTPSAAGGGEGGNPSLFETHLHLDVKVTNTGGRNGKEVVQLYVSFPEDVRDFASGALIEFPVKVLRNFHKIELAAGDSEIVGLNLTRKDLSYWSVAQQNWVMPDGEFVLRVGRSSRNLPLVATY